MEHTIQPLWASDTGRNSNSGKYSGTFIGYFDQLKVSVGKTNQTQMTEIRNHVDVPIMDDVTFVDSKTGESKTESFYGTAIPAKTNNTKQIYEPFEFTLTAIEARSDM